uniref:Gamma-tubulin complex component n=1 Tax=Piliocolobus tephrosceles TaxID=591936 RepID=A0A8C9GAA9_9PRIM
MYILLQESYKILRILVNILEESFRSTGCKLLSFLYLKSKTYDYEEQKVYKKILQRCVKPINNILKHWINSGELKDKYNETFISIDNNVQGEQTWMYRFILNSSNIPLFISFSTAKKILLTGKSMYLLNYFVKNNNIEDNSSNTNSLLFNYQTGRHNDKTAINRDNFYTTPKYNNTIASGITGGITNGISGGTLNQGNNNNIKNGQPFDMFNNTKEDYFSNPSDSEFIIDIFTINDINLYIENVDNYINKISKKKNKKLITLLIQKYGLYDHFRAFRHFLFLVDGNLFESIYENMKTDLYMNAEELKRHYLNNKLEHCLKSSAIFTSNPSIIKKLIIDQFNIHRGDIGWDILVLDFVIEKPLDIIFTKTVKNIYKSINVVLIKLKKIVCELSNIWYLFTHLFKIINLIYYNPVFTFCNIIRNEMYHFVYNVLSYFYYDVIDMSWYAFKKKILLCNDLDQLIKEHYQYIKQIQFDLFLCSYNELTRSKNEKKYPTNIYGTYNNNNNNNNYNTYNESNENLDCSTNNDIYQLINEQLINKFQEAEYESFDSSDYSDEYSDDLSFETNKNESNKKNNNTTSVNGKENYNSNRSNTKYVNNDIHTCFNKILNIITKFINITSALISSICENYSNIKKLTEENKNKNENNVDDVNNYINYNIIGEKTIKDIKMLLKYYRNYIYKFICLLLSENKFTHINSKHVMRDNLYSLRLLAARIDFNLYYVNVSKAASMKNANLNISKQINMINQ